MIRLTWDEYFMKLAEAVALRSTCIRRQVGSVIVKDRNVISTGYNGSLSGHVNCCEFRECFRLKNGILSGESLHLCVSVHAEINAITQAAKHGNSISGATMYLTLLPCRDCAKAIISSGINRVVFMESYPHTDSRTSFMSSKVELVKLERS